MFALQQQAHAQALRQVAMFGGDAARRVVAQHLGHRRHAAVDFDAQVLAEAAPRSGQIPHGLHRQAQPAREAVGLHLALHDDQFVVLEQILVGVEQIFVRHRFDRLALVVELEDRNPPALAVDDAQVADDAGQQLGLAAVQHIGIAALGELAHLGRALVEHVARQIKAQRRLFEQQALANAPRRGRHQLGLLRRCGV